MPDDEVLCIWNGLCVIGDVCCQMLLTLLAPRFGVLFVFCSSFQFVSHMVRVLCWIWHLKTHQNIDLITLIMSTICNIFVHMSHWINEKIQLYHISTVIIKSITHAHRHRTVVLPIYKTKINLNENVSNSIGCYNNQFQLCNQTMSPVLFISLRIHCRVHYDTDTLVTIIFGQTLIVGFIKWEMNLFQYGLRK